MPKSEFFVVTERCLLHLGLSGDIYEQGKLKVSGTFFDVLSLFSLGLGRLLRDSETIR